MNIKPAIPTLANINEFSLAQIIIYVGVNMLKQGRRSEKNQFECAFRGDDGTKCAIGFLIPDEIYKPELEACSSAAELIERLKFPNPLGGRKSLLNELQQIHDKTSSWHLELERLATHCGCRDEVLEAFIEAGVEEND